MKAMYLSQIVNVSPGSAPLTPVQIPIPEAGDGEVLIKVSVCGVCHTELDEIEGRTPPPRLPVILGHQAVGRIEACGPHASLYSPGQRVGVAWVYSTCGRCTYCLAGEENLCPDFRATGRDANGGYAEYLVVQEKFACPIPEAVPSAEAAPLLCAGAIGYRSLRLSAMRDGQKLGLTGFGASAHLVLKLAAHLFPNSPVYVFSRSAAERAFALELGAVWAGEIGAPPPELLNAIIDTTPAWKPIVAALACLAPGGRLVINAIRKQPDDQSELLRLDYPAHLWMEKEIKSVANVSRRDVVEFLDLAARIPIHPEIQEYPLDQANRALIELKTGKIRGAKVLRIDK